MQKQNETKTSY